MLFENSNTAHRQISVKKNVHSENDKFLLLLTAVPQNSFQGALVEPALYVTFRRSLCRYNQLWVAAVLPQSQGSVAWMCPLLCTRGNRAWSISWAGCGSPHCVTEHCSCAPASFTYQPLTRGNQVVAGPLRLWMVLGHLILCTCLSSSKRVCWTFPGPLPPRGQVQCTRFLPPPFWHSLGTVFPSCSNTDPSTKTFSPSSTRLSPSPASDAFLSLPAVSCNPRRGKGQRRTPPTELQHQGSVGSS